MRLPSPKTLRPLYGALALLLSCAPPILAGEQPLGLKNPGFESDLDGWFPAKGDAGMSAASPEAAHSGKQGLRVTDADDKRGSSLASEKFNAGPGTTYELRFWGRSVSGAGIGVYLQFLDAHGGKLTDLDDPHGGTERVNVIKTNVPAHTAEWKQYTLRGVGPENAASVYIWVHSSNSNTSVTDLDDFELVKID